MSNVKFAAIAAVAAIGSFMSPAFADDMKPGMMTMTTADGKMSSMPMPDQAHVTMMLKSAQVMGEDMVLFAWGGKFYVAKNEKMPDGKMTFDYWGLHGTK